MALAIRTEIVDIMYRPDGSVFIFHKITSGPEHLIGRVVTSQIKEEKLLELLQDSKEGKTHV